MTRKEIGDALGITPQAVGALIKRGMPSTSIAAARAWRERNIDLTRSRPARPKPKLTSPDYVIGDRLEWAPDDVDWALGQIKLFGTFADSDFAAWQAPLRLAMAALPSSAWDDVTLPAGVWRQLVGERHLALLKADEKKRKPGRGSAAEGDPFVAEHGLYLLASGLLGIEAPANA